MARRVLALSEARDYVPDLSHARHVFSILQPWFELIENSVQTAQEAREGLLAGGDLAFTSYSYHMTVVGLLDCAPTMDACLAQVDAGLSFVRRTGSEQPNQWLHCYHWLADVLRREGAADQAPPADAYQSNPLTLIHVHLTRAIAAAISGDQAALARYSAAALPLLPVVVGFSNSAMAHPLRGLQPGLGGPRRRRRRARGAPGRTGRGSCAGWPPGLPTRRTTSCTCCGSSKRNGHRPTATSGPPRSPSTPPGGLGSRQRPWHRALITERAGRFHLAYGLEQAGYELLAQAREEYLAWGATAKAGQLDWAYPALRLADISPDGEQPASAPQDRILSSAGAIDLLGVLSASQVLSSETSVERLHARVAEVLAAMTGATGVRLVLWDEERQNWRQARGSGDAARTFDDDDDDE